MIKLIDLLKEEDYKGTHTAPDKTSDAPLPITRFKYSGPNGRYFINL